MRDTTVVSLLARAASMHHAIHTVLVHTRGMGMMPGAAAFMHHDNKGHNTLNRYVALKWLVDLNYVMAID